jgi:threonine dehydrogenase-like Zn-dependent dehydrogenase
LKQDRMKAAVYYGPYDIQLKDVEVPHANAEGVVVKVEACGVCDILDLPVWQHWPEGGRGVGLIRGHEFSGEIVEAGSMVTDFKVGDRIFSEPVYRPCYRCEACKMKDYWRCSRGGENEIGKAINGAFAEYIAIPFLNKMNGVKVPDTMSYHDLALIDHLSLASSLARRTEYEKFVVILGQDITGLGAAAMMKKRKVAKVITADISKIRQKASEEAGADIVIDSVNQDPVQVVMKETNGIGADCVIICDNRPVAYIQAVSMVRNMGKIWTTRPDFVRLNPNLLPDQSAKFNVVTPESAAYRDPAINLSPTFAAMQFGFGYGYKQLRFQEAIELLQSGKCNAEKLVTQVFPLDRIKEAFEVAMDPHKSIKVLIEPP